MCSHVPMEIFLFYHMRKKGNKKRVDYIKGGSMRSPEVREHPRVHTHECPSLRRMHEYRNLPYNFLCQGAYPWWPIMPGPSREPSLGLGATSLTIRSLPPGLFVTFFLGDDMGVIGNRIIMLSWMRGILVDENTAHESS